MRFHGEVGAATAEPSPSNHASGRVSDAPPASARFGPPALLAASAAAAVLPSLDASIAASSLVSLAAFVLSVHWNRSRRLPRSLCALQAAAGLFAVGSAIRVAEAATAGGPVYPGFADLVIFPAYVATVFGVGRAAMARHALSKLADAVDAATVALVALTVSFSLSSEYLFAADTSGVERWVSLAYTGVELVFLTVVLLLVFGPGTRTAGAKYLAFTGLYTATFDAVYDVLLAAGLDAVVDNLYRTISLPLVTYAIATSHTDYASFAQPGVRPQTLRWGLYATSLGATALLLFTDPSTAAAIGVVAVAGATTIRLGLSHSVATRLQALSDAQSALAASLADADDTEQAFEATLEACVRVLPSNATITLVADPDPLDVAVLSHDGTIGAVVDIALRPHEVSAATQILDVASLAVEAVEARTERVLEALQRDWDALAGAGHEMVFMTVDGIVTTSTPNAARVLGTSPRGRSLAELLGTDLDDLEQRGEVVFPTGDGRWMAVSGQPAEGDALVVTVRDATARIRAERIDPITGLPNMVDFARQREIENTTLIWHRVEAFDRINDQLGKQGADDFLRLLADRIGTRIRRDIDVLWRGDGPTFVVACPGAQQPAAEVEARAGALSQPVEVNGKRVAPTITTVVVPVDHPVGVDTAIHRAELTLNQPRRDREQVLMFEPNIEAAAQRRYRIEEALLAVTDPESSGFRVHYQPILDARSLETDRLEALMRWEHPTIGRVSPGEFIPAAERVGCAAMLDRFVLDRAVRDRRRFAEVSPGIGVQVNLSPVGLTPDRIRELTGWIVDHADAPDCLTIEIIESVIGEDSIGELIEAMQELRATGVGLSVDDFGIGESNLHRVMALPLTQVKLAGLFSTDDTIHPDTISRLIDTIHSLGHSCVVESVETEQQAAVLRTAGADLLQGWLYARDMPADDLVAYLGESVEV